MTVAAPASIPTACALDVRGLCVAYGRVEALRGIDIQVMHNEVVAVIGANGAGKTTLLKTLSGLLRPSAGHAAVLAQAGNESTSELARQGLLHIPEGRGTLQSLSVLDNLKIAYDIRGCPFSFEHGLDLVFKRFPRLQQRQDQNAGNLSGGEQQMLALSRALINPPRLLLLDEPSLGLSPLMVKEVYKTLRTLKSEGMTMLLVEQNVRVALNLADRAYVLRQGQVVRQGTSSELLADPDFVAHYLGTH